MGLLTNIGFDLGLLENPSVRCFKNRIKHKFLLWKWESLGVHNLELVNISKWGANNWHKYELDIECKDCKARFNRFGVNESELINNGFELPK